MSYDGPNPLPVVAGGTGDASTTAYAVICGGTTSTGALQSIAGVGTAGQILTSNGAGALPTFQNASSGGITTLDGNSGSATGATVTITTGAANANGTATFTGSVATLTLNSTDASNNVGWGSGVLSSASLSGVNNIAFGYNCLAANTTGQNNACFGYNVMPISQSGANIAAFGVGVLASLVISGNANNDGHCVFGNGCLAALTGGYQNVVVGDSGAYQLLTGHRNVIIGTAGGANFTSSGSGNLILGGQAVTGDNNITRIGYLYPSNGTASTQSACYIDGIYGATTSSAGTTLAVLIDDTGNLGTVASSIRYKENIKSIDRSILNLRPVQFNYIKDKSKTLEFGLIAEEVEQSFPELVVYKEGQTESVRYHELPALLLNEIQKLNKRIGELEAKCR